MTAYIQTLLQISITMAAVIGVLLLLVPVWQKRYSVKLRKLIWLIIAVRLLIPVSIELPATPITLDVDLEQQSGIIKATQETVFVDTHYDLAIAPENEYTSKPDSEITVMQVPYKEPISYGALVAAIWILGMILFALWHSVQYSIFHRRVMASVKPLEDSEELLIRAGEDLALNRYPNVLLSSGVQSPMLIGFRKPTILLPYRLYGENELVMILRHELMHYKHYDLWYKLILLCANGVHWFNPLVWLMNRQAGRDIEQVCDDYVVAEQDMAYRKAYSMTILNTMASQKGVALSTHLSKEAQNNKKRFAGILQPKQYKKGVVVLVAVLLLTIGASGCLQVGKVDEGVVLYNRVAEYLPDNAIHNPEVYEVQGVDDKNATHISYIWLEEKYSVTEDEYNQAGSLKGYHYWSKKDGHFLYKRSLGVFLSKETGTITSIYYANNDETKDLVKPAEIGRNKEKRDAYVQEIAEEFLENGDTLTFIEGYTETDEKGNITVGYYFCGTEVDDKQYAIALDYIEGYLLAMYAVDYLAFDKSDAVIWRDYTIMLEGMEETVQLYLNRQPNYYALYTDPTLFSSQISGIGEDGSFCDVYLRDPDDDTLIETYMKVGFVPHITIGEWLDEVETDSDFAKFAPQVNPLSSYQFAAEWEPTGEYKVFANEPNRQWREYVSSPGVVNRCYLTTYRDGVLSIQISHPYGSAYMEGIGSRINQMLDTLVLATE